MTKVAVIYYSSSGTNYTMANAVAGGAKGAGAEVRVKLVTETAPADAIAQNPKWKEFHEKHKDDPKAELADLEWADAVIFGTPTRYGAPAGQLKAFLDSTGGLWQKGKLANKVYAGFTSAANAHGGQETTLIGLFTSLIHWGGILIPPGYSDSSVFASGGNPYGPSVTVGMDGKPPTEQDLASAKYLGERVAKYAAKLA